MLITTLSASLEQEIIKCAIEAHRELGPGLLESIYERALAIELRHANLAFERQVPLPVLYKGERLGTHRADVIVEKQVVVEVKAVAQIAPVHVAQMLTYLHITNLKIGLILNFNCPTLKEGIKRVIA
jgi:GxxExxY protein